MRILRLVDDGVFAVEFHPYITVVADASADQRDRIARAFSEAAQGRTTELQGLIEVHGVVLDLDERALDLLELDDSEVRTSLFAEDLPGATASGVDRQVRVAEDRLEALEQPNRDRTEALQEAEAALEQALRAEEDARAALAAASASSRRFWARARPNRPSSASRARSTSACASSSAPRSAPPDWAAASLSISARATRARSTRSFAASSSVGDASSPSMSSEPAAAIRRSRSPSRSARLNASVDGTSSPLPCADRTSSSASRTGTGS